jgi:hypothetical protein
MNRNLIISIIEGYENQLLNAEIRKDEKEIAFLKQQINEGHRALATMAVYK